MDYRYALQLDPTISASDARELIFYFIRWGDLSERHFKNLPDATIEKMLATQGYKLDQRITELTQNPHKHILQFENLLENHTWNFVATPGAIVTVSTLVDGIEIPQIQDAEHGLIREPHRAAFVAACEARDAAIANNNFDSFYTALATGFSSLEAYMTLRTFVFNAKCTPSERLDERRPKRGYVSFEEKLREWVPIMTGKSIDFGTSAGWNDFLYLQSLRNDVVIHPKPGKGLKTLDELADGINRFRYGIGSLMFLLHQAFDEPMQRSIIRAMRYPTVRVIRTVSI